MEAPPPPPHDRLRASAAGNLGYLFGRVCAQRTEARWQPLRTGAHRSGRASRERAWQQGSRPSLQGGGGGGRGKGGEAPEESAAYCASLCARARAPSDTLVRSAELANKVTSACVSMDAFADCAVFVIEAPKRAGERIFAFPFFFATGKLQQPHNK